MNPEDVVRFQERLLAERAELLTAAEASKEGQGTVELDQARIGRLSRMDAMQAQAMSVELGRRREIRLKRIGAALKRIDDGEYGLCASCEEEIAFERLEFDPALPLCRVCAERSERSHSP